MRGRKTVGWVERSEPHQLRFSRFLVGLADQRFASVPVAPPYACFRGVLVLLLAATLCTGRLPAIGGEPAEAIPAAKKDEKPAAADAPDKLAAAQRRIADQYKHLEDVLLRMAELTAASDPRRAALLKKAVAQSKEQLLDVQFDRLIELLQKDQLSRAIEGQTAVSQDLRALLELLSSENRAKQLESQKKRLQEYLKRLGDLIKEQKGIQGRTAGGENAKPLSDEQRKLGEKTGNLAKDIKTNEEGKTKSDSKGPAADEKQATPGKGDKPAAEEGGKPREKAEEKEPGQAKGGDQDKNQAKDKNSQQDKPGQSEGKAKAKTPPTPGENKGQEGQKGDADEQPSDPGEPQKQGQTPTPARQRLEAAQQRMQQAEEKLKRAQRPDAVEKQEQAISELEQAKAALEEILRQLRQEEIQRTLAMLEARFRKMLDLQRDVYEGTLRLNKVPAADRTQSHEIEASHLSSKQSQIVVEADKALLLLREDGSAVVFPEAVGQMREDMQQASLRLAQAKVEQITQGIEQDVISALEEMIDALKKAQKDKQKDQRKPPRFGQAQPSEPPLVDALAELKMIRALQMRVNTRTQRYAKLIDGEQAEQAELVEALRRLAERETRIHRVTRDLELGKNQ